MEDDIPDKNLLFSLFFTRGSSNLHEVKYCPTFLSFLLLLFLTWRRRGRRKNLSGAGSTPSKNGHQWGGGETLLGMGRDYDDRRKREIQLRMLSSSRETRPVWIIMSVGEA